MQIFTQKAQLAFLWMGCLSVEALTDSHCSLSLWINGLVCGHCPSLSMCGSPPAWLASGLALGFVHEVSAE